MSGYQIRHGETTVSGQVQAALPDGLGFTCGPVLGIYLHGVLEASDVLEALFGETPGRSLDATFDLLADAVEECIDIAALLRVAGHQ